MAKPHTSQEKIITYGYHPTLTVLLPPSRLKQTEKWRGAPQPAAASNAPVRDGDYAARGSPHP